VKRMFGEYMYHSNQVSQHGKRDGYESISVLLCCMILKNLLFHNIFA